MTSLYDFSFKTLLEAKTLSLSEFKGKVLLLVNTASKCGFTNQYQALEHLHKKYKDQGLIIIGIPSNDFMDQEPGTSEEIATFCSRTFGVTFLLMQKEKVVGNEKHPFFNWAKEQNGFGSGVKWNFHKYLFDRKGNALTFFMPTTPPDAPKVIKAIEQALTS